MVVDKTEQDYVGKKNVVIAVEMLDYAGLLDYGSPVGFGDLNWGLLDYPGWALAIFDYAKWDLLEESLIVEDCKWEKEYIEISKINSKSMH